MWGLLLEASGWQPQSQWVLIQSGAITAQTDEDGDSPALAKLGGRADEETMASGHIEPSSTPEHVQEQEAERKKLRRLQIMIDMVMSVIAQDPHLSLEEATQMANDAKRAALSMFPDKELAFDLLYKPRLQRLLRERFRII